MVAENMKRFTISMDEKLYDQLKQLAQQDKRTISNAIAYIVEEYLNKSSERA